MSTLAAVIGRILIALLFLVAGFNKVMDASSADAMIQQVGMPAGLGMVTGICEIVGGLCLVFGIMTRLVAVLLFLFTGLTTLLFHNNFMDPVQGVMALKNIAIMGGLLLVFAHSQMWWSYDAMRTRRRGEIATRDAELRAHDAELRAARAEGAAEAAGQVATSTAGDVTSLPPRRRWRLF